MGVGIYDWVKKSVGRLIRWIFRGGSRSLVVFLVVTYIITAVVWTTLFVRFEALVGASSEVVGRNWGAGRNRPRIGVMYVV
jgi:hypothetical protein